MGEIETNFDYIIVGGGAAGCVLANRLSKNPKNKVLLIEAGGRDWSPAIHIPAGEALVYGNPRFDWCYKARPDATRGGKIDVWPAGKVLGGSSSINGMVYIRGNRADYDEWADAGNPGWSYQDVLPYFRSIESFELGESDYHGSTGPLSVVRMRAQHVTNGVFLNALTQLGYKTTENFNGESQEGAGVYQTNQRHGRRCSAAVGFLNPARRRRNLTIVTRAQATRVSPGPNPSVTFVHRDKIREAIASREVIISCGAIGSPKLLMLSGIGCESELRRIGIEPRVNLPGVGKNLMEHPGSSVGIQVNVRTFNQELNPWGFIKNGVNWLLNGAGPATTPAGTTGAFLKTSKDLDRPNIQIHFAPFGYDYDPAVGKVSFPRIPIVGAGVYPLQPKSRGSVSLASPDPAEPPVIQHEAFAEREDINTLVSGLKIVRQAFLSPAFRKYFVAELAPGSSVQTDEQWESYARENTELGYHPSGTCGMGNGRLAVVDQELRVRGLAGLRVVDASIMPTLVSGNTNAPTMMIGEKAADMILRS